MRIDKLNEIEELYNPQLDSLGAEIGLIEDGLAEKKAQRDGLAEEKREKIRKINSYYDATELVEKGLDI